MAKNNEVTCSLVKKLLLHISFVITSQAAFSTFTFLPKTAAGSYLKVPFTDVLFLSLLKKPDPTK